MPTLHIHSYTYIGIWARKLLYTQSSKSFFLLSLLYFCKCIFWNRNSYISLYKLVSALHCDTTLSGCVSLTCCTLDKSNQIAWTCYKCKLISKRLSLSMRFDLWLGTSSIMYIHLFQEHYVRTNTSITKIIILLHVKAIYIIWFDSIAFKGLRHVRVDGIKWQTN